jgi:NTE family protein
MLEALYERGIRPDLIVGTSAGALNGAFIATRPRTVETARELGLIWRCLTHAVVFPVNPLTGTRGFLGLRCNLVSDSGLRGLIAPHLTVEGVLPPVLWEGRELIDGGVTNNVPVTHAVALGARKIYILAAGAACELDERPKGAVAMLPYGIGLMTGHRRSADLAALGPDIEVHLIPPPCPLTVQPTDFAHAAELIDLGHENAALYLDRRRHLRVVAPARWRPSHPPAEARRSRQ